MTTATDSERTRKWVLHTAALGIEHSPRLRRGASRVAAVHIWASPSPSNRPPREVTRPLLWAAAIATAIAAIVDLILTARLVAPLDPSRRSWVRSLAWLVLWAVVFVGLQNAFERRNERKLAADARAMTFDSARAIVVAELARHPEDPRALELLRESEASDWFRSTAR